MRSSPPFRASCRSPLPCPQHLGSLLLTALLAVQVPWPARAEGPPEPSSSTSASPRAESAPTRGIGGEVLITFSEHPLGTPISDQYGSQGILFGGDSPFISGDGANPTSPVLSGTPRFQGAIEGRFVDPEDATTPVTVGAFSLDAGYFDAIGSVRLVWFDLDGNSLGQRINTGFGIRSFVIEASGIARWRIEIVQNEPAGFAIDNVSFDPSITSSILFREKTGDRKDGTWGFLNDEIPGFDHVAFHLDDSVYESHPGYLTGTYVDEDGSEAVAITEADGVQSQHSRGTFEHDARIGEPSPVVDFEELAIPRGLAVSMEAWISGRIGSKFQGIDFRSPEGIEATLSPAAQKGGGGTFTCVGLVEWAAERAGHRGGQGFIKDSFESFSYPVSVFPPEFRTAPLLSPQLLNYAMKLGDKIDAAKMWFQGFFDPVDFVVIDPIGRRLGYSRSLGELNEIPDAFFSGDGQVEQFFIPNPVPGEYRIELSGLDEQVLGAVNCASDGSSEVAVVDEFLPQDASKTVEVMVEMIPGGAGDLDADGDVDTVDFFLLIALLDSFVSGPGHPGDIDGDGVITAGDVRLWDSLCAANGCPASFFADGFESGDLGRWSYARP